MKSMLHKGKLFKCSMMVSILALGALSPAMATDRAGYEVMDLTFSELSWSKSIKESANVYFYCPSGQVMTGRSHSGDENGDTKYQCGKLLANGEPVVVNGTHESPRMRESGSNFRCQSNSIMIARWHNGDENGDSRYKCTYPFYNGMEMIITDQMMVGPKKESSSTFSSVGDKKIIVGRKHDGDENGNTVMYYAGLKGYVDPNSNDDITLGNGGYDYSYPEGLGEYESGVTVVLGRDGYRYECQPFPNGGWCNIDSALYYEPGLGLSWQDAWVRLP